MVFALVVISASTGVALALLGLALSLMRRGLDLSTFVLAAVSELTVLVQVVVALVRLALGERPDSLPLTLSYLITVVFVLPVGAYWALGERSRWSNVVLSVAGATVAAMMVRLWDLWPA